MHTKVYTDTRPKKVLLNSGHNTKIKIVFQISCSPRAESTTGKRFPDSSISPPVTVTSGLHCAASVHMHVWRVNAISQVNIGQRCCVHSIHRNTEKAAVYSDSWAGFGYKLETILSSLLLSGRVCAASLWLWVFSHSCSDSHCSRLFCSRKFTQDGAAFRQTAKDSVFTARWSLKICREITWECVWAGVEVEKKWECPREKHGIQDNKKGLSCEGNMVLIGPVSTYMKKCKHMYYYVTATLASSTLFL